MKSWLEFVETVLISKDQEIRMRENPQASGLLRYYVCASLTTETNIIVIELTKRRLEFEVVINSFSQTGRLWKCQCYVLESAKEKEHISHTFLLDGLILLH